MEGLLPHVYTVWLLGFKAARQLNHPKLFKCSNLASNDNPLGPIFVTILHSIDATCSQFQIVLHYLSWTQTVFSKYFDTIQVHKKTKKCCAKNVTNTQQSQDN